MEIPKRTRRLGRLLEGIPVDNSSGVPEDDEVQVIVNNNQQQRCKVKKTAKKFKSKEDEELDNALRESGIDCTDMTREEKMDIAQVVMASKREAEILNQSYGEDLIHSDSEEEEKTASAFQQAMHPGMVPDSSQSSNDNNRTSHKARLNLSPVQLDEWCNHDTEEVVEKVPHKMHKNEDFGTFKHTSTNEPIVISSLDPSIPHVDSSNDLSQKVLNSSQHRTDAFSEAVHPKSSPDDVMEEDPIPVQVQKSEGSTKSGPTQVRMRKINQRNVDKKQPSIEQFSHVIITEDKDNDGLEKNIDVEKCGNSASEDQWLTARPKGFDNDEESRSQDARKDFTKEQLQDLMSEEERSPLKCAKIKEKKTFKWSDSSDEETQNYLMSEEKIEEHNSQRDNCLGQNDSKPVIQIDSSQHDPVVEVEAEPIPEDFYSFPPLQRHYRNVKKQTGVRKLVFAPVESCPAAYTKAVIQLFTLYQLRLSKLQRLSKKLIPWSNEPVKVGYHLEHTIDARKRGYSYEPMDDGDNSRPGTSVVLVDDDFKETVQKPQAKIFTFKTKKEDPQKDIDGFLETFIDKPQRSLRSTRKYNDMQHTVAEMTEDFDPFIPSNGNLTNQKGGQGRKRKLYYDADKKIGAINEDDDFEFNTKAVQKPKRTVRIKQDKKTSGSQVDAYSEMKGKSFQRHASDLSTGSLESMKSEDIDNLLNPVRPQSRTNESSLDGLSQNSDVLLDSQGQLYSTQFCAMKEKRANTSKHERGNFDLSSVDNDSVQFTSRNQVNEDSDGTIIITDSKDQLKVKPLYRTIVPKQEPENNRQTVTVTSIQSEANQETDKQSSIKSKIIGTLGDLFKLGPKDVGKKELKVQTVSRNDSDDDKDVQITSNMEDDIEKIHVNKDGIRNYNRKIGRKRPRAAEEDDEVKIQKINMVPCPLCNRNFPQDFIENHAADCNGQADDENDINSNGSQENMQRLQEMRPQGQSTSATPRLGRRRNQKQDDVADFIVNDEIEKEKEVPQKSKMSCYVCDKPFTNQQSYDLHVEKCLNEARMIQEQVDVEGMDSLLEAEQGEIQTPKRKTRSNRAGGGTGARFIQPQVDAEYLELEPEVPTARSARKYPRTINTTEGQ